MTVTNKRDSLSMLALGSPSNYRAAKRLARNTWRYTSLDGVEHVRLHHTDIISFLPKGRVRLTTGGWRSVTTKERMSQFSGYNVSSQRGQWMVHAPYRGEGEERQAVPYFDGIILPDAFGSKRKRAEKEAARVARVVKAINAFVRHVGTLDKYPLPSAGDCWLCSMMHAEKPRDGNAHDYNTVKGQGGPDATADHLWSHVTEQYVHGALLVNALRWRGTQETGIGYLLGMKPEPKSIVCNALRGYLKRKLGVG